MKKSIRCIARICSYFYPEKILKALKGLFRLTKSEYYVRKLKSSGNNIRFFSPDNLVGLEYISVGNNFTSDVGLVLQCWDKYENYKYTPEIIIGNNVYLGKRCHIAAIDKITIGDNLLTGSNVYISDHSHGTMCVEELSIPPIQRVLYSKGNVSIGNNVWLGDNVSVLPGVTIGDNVIVGANSVVTKNIGSNTIAVGIPARVIREL